ncbi:hypothetical protein ACIQ6K_39765 [Streptomyces sp. NPDC096354]|uniref:hypothetical protein n=1 Tax=Streptomyces sp. NPDC096354 TaxID=3366088 RepID=UPI00382204E5
MVRAERQLHRPGTRELYVSATDTGKTLTSSRIANALDARLVLDLAVQTALAWRADGHGEHKLIVSSLDAVSHDALARTGSARPVTSTPWPV